MVLTSYNKLVNYMYNNHMGMLELNWLLVLIFVFESSTVDDMGPRGEDKLPIILSETVVWEVKESVYNFFSSLLSSLCNISDNCLKSEGPFDFRSAEASWSDATMC